MKKSLLKNRFLSGCLAGLWLMSLTPTQAETWTYKRPVGNHPFTATNWNSTDSWTSGVTTGVVPGSRAGDSLVFVSPPASKPNIIVIMCDDLGYGDIEPYGSLLNRTPNLNRMAAEGMKLTSFYAATVCTPSRAQLMTGCYAKRVGMSGLLEPVDNNGLATSESTVATLLKARGYATMAVGKWHLGDQLEFMPVRHGFERFVGLPYSHNYIGNSSGVPPLPLVNGEVVVKAPPELSQLTATFTQESVNFIRTTAAAAKPFFLYIPHIATHVPLVPGVAFQGRTPRPYSDWTEELDWSVGQVLDTLRELKIDKNTLVIFTSDNGPWLSFGAQGGVAGPLRGGKFSAWEGGVRVPTIAWWPGRIPANSTCDTMISNIDILPTAVGLAGGGALPNVIDGIDIWPLLSGQTTTSTREAIFYWSGMTLVGVRSGKWKLMVEAQPGSTGTMPQLYDLENDIGETTDVKDQHPDVVARLLEHNTRIAAQLGARGNTAPSIRPQGTVANPVPLLMMLPNEYK